MHPDNAVVVAVKMSRTAMKGGAAVEDDEEETAAHEAYVKVLDKAVGGESLYRQQMQESQA